MAPGTQHPRSLIAKHDNAIRALDNRAPIKAVRKKPITVLVADDDAMVRESLRKVLKEAGFNVVLAADGREAVERFASERVQMMILDLGLPMQNGWNVFERIADEHPALPIIIITGQPLQEQLAAAAGVGALMEKPLDPNMLLETMKAVLAEPRKVRLRRACGQTQKLRYVPSRSAQFLRRIREQCEPSLRLSDSDDKEAW